MSLYTVRIQCSMYPESPVVDDDVCMFTGILFKVFLSCYFICATSNKRFCENGEYVLQMYKRINAYIFITSGSNSPSSFNPCTCTIHVVICYMCVSENSTLFIPLIMIALQMRLQSLIG